MFSKPLPAAPPPAKAGAGERPQSAAGLAAIIFGTGTFWGLYWLPVRALAELGLAGACGTAAITAAAVARLRLLMSRRYDRRRRNLKDLIARLTSVTDRSHA